MKDRLVELRLWRQFVAVAQELHFGHAAERLNMTQPPLTQAIALLEQLLRVRLFDRTKRSVRLTAGGEALLPDVLDLLARAQAPPDRARAVASGEVGRVRLAFVSTVGFTLLPQWVMAFRQQQPQVRLELVEATGDVQLLGFARGEIDAGFMLHAPGFASEGLTQLRVAHEPLMLALPAQHRLALRKAAPTLRELLHEPLVIFPRRIAPSLHDAIFGLYHRAGAVPVVAQEAIQMQTIVNLVSAGFGVAWVPATVRQFQRPGVCYRSIRVSRKAGPAHDSPTDTVTNCETSLVWSDARANPALQRFIAFARQQVP
jgi:DNA-binding transcriptional LysR family regulator